MTDERAILNRIVVAHNRLRRSETTAHEFDQYALGLLTDLRTPAASSDGRDGAREALDRLFDQAFSDGIAAGKSGDESILAGSSAAYAQSALAALAASRPTDAGTGDAGDWRCKGCGWVGKDAIGMDHPQNGCDLELMRFHLATPKPPVDEGINGWQPIETAPKDRMLLLAAEFDKPGDWRVKTGCWHDSGYWQVFGASWTPTMWHEQPAPPTRNLTGDGAGA